MCRAPTQRVNKWISNDHHLALTETLSLHRAGHTERGQACLQLRLAQTLARAAHVFALCKRVPEWSRRARGSLGKSVSHIAKGEHVRAGMCTGFHREVEACRGLHEHGAPEARLVRAAALQRRRRPAQRRGAEQALRQPAHAAVRRLLAVRIMPAECGVLRAAGGRGLGKSLPVDPWLGFAVAAIGLRKERDPGGITCSARRLR